MDKSVIWTCLLLLISRLANCKRCFPLAVFLISYSLRKEIEALEEQGDDIKDTGFDKLYQAASQLHFLQFYHYSEMLHKCDDILDNAEDLSDVIVSAVTSILK